MATVTLHSRTLHVDLSQDSLTQHYGQLPDAAILGGHEGQFTSNRFSYWLAEPREILHCPSGQSDCLKQLTEAVNRYHLHQTQDAKGLFIGGWVGAFSYDLGRAIEQLPQIAQDDLHMPWIRLGFYDRVLAYDHKHGIYRQFVLTWPGDMYTVTDKFDWLKKQIDQAQYVLTPPPPAAREVDLTEVSSNMSREDYFQSFARVKQYILDGETYQINLSQRFSLPFDGDPVDLYRWQNQYNPSPYAAYLAWPNHKLVSTSPELFVHIQGDQIRTQPIKGTRPRHPHDEAFNDRQIRELQGCLKEQAELNMIVDLERNDLARLCVPGTRSVQQPRSIEAFETVYHALATVGGTLRPELDWADILKAIFPGGSITGAPKLRSMEIIEELEPHQRGIYTGSIGFIGVDGTACLNIAIRTIIITSQTAYAQAGGGIVADSDPAAEYEETLTKAQALLAGIQAVQKNGMME